MEWIEPNKRFNNIHFSNEIVDGRSLPLNSEYICPNCGQGISFMKNHFENRADRIHSNLQDEINVAFNRSAKEKGIDKYEFLDSECPKCKFPVRVYVQKWAGGKHGDSGVSLISIIEGWPKKKDR